MLIPLLLLAAFGIDLNSIWRTDAELQQAADAGALAGMDCLLDAHRASGQKGNVHNKAGQTQMAQANSAAQHEVSLHQAGGVALVLASGDIQLGYITDPTAKPTTPEGQFQTGSGTPFPNSMQVTVRRDGTVSSGPLSLILGGIFGVPTVNRQATATASLRDQLITGFKGAPCKLLPIAIDEATYNWMLGGGGRAPTGCSKQDLFTVNSPTSSGLLPPLNVLPGPDGLMESSTLPVSTAPGNFGLISLRNSADGVAADYQNWVTNGPSAADLASFGTKGLQATAGTPASMYGGLDWMSFGTLGGDLAMVSIIGQPRALVVYRTVSGTGTAASYQVVGFVGATVVAYAPSVPVVGPVLGIQLSATIDPTAARSGAPGSTTFIYSGVSLSR
jgi:Flp pilus assembly protein TadG